MMSKALPPLETDRLLLREMTLDDAGDMFELASDPQVVRHILWDLCKTLDDTRALLMRYIDRYRQDQFAPWGLVLKETGRLIGTCGFVDVNARHARGVIAYSLHRQLWGKGYMTEAVLRALSYGFDELELERIEATCMPDNIASARVLEKVGMSFEGLLRRYMRTRGEHVDVKLYSIIRSEWESSTRQTGVQADAIRCLRRRGPERP